MKPLLPSSATAEHNVIRLLALGHYPQTDGRCLAEATCIASADAAQLERRNIARHDGRGAKDCDPEPAYNAAMALPTQELQRPISRTA